MVLGKDKKLRMIKIPKAEALIKLCRIENKRTIKGGKIQLNLHDGSNIISDKEDFRMGDSPLLTLPKREIKNVIKLEKGALVYLKDGSHAGSIGKVEGVDSQHVIVKLGDDTIETLKRFSIVIGTEKPLCTVVENG
jgi:small subunit ribosomal protein S4e